MRWAQLSLYYENIRRSSPIKTGYFPALLYRCKKAMGSAYNRSRVRDDLNTFIAQYDAAIQAGFNAKKQSSPPTLKTNVLDSWILPRPDYPTRIITLVRLSPDQNVERLLVVDSLPDQRAGRQLYDAVDGLIRFKPQSKESEASWTYLAVTLDDQIFRVR